MRLNKKQLLLLFILPLILFYLFRVGSILHQTVGYTYDQGRDFLKTAEIVLYKNPTFIGPTTGIMGIYHGAWWYYILAIAFILFNGSPIGFYWFNLLVQFLVFLGFSYLILKKSNYLVAFSLGLLIAVSPYFIYTATFVGNNTMVLPFLFLFLALNFLLLEDKLKKTSIIIFLLGLSLGIASELEFALGLFLIPAYFVTTVVFSKLRTIIWTKKNSLFFLLSLFSAFIFRILFEIKHGFIQTKTLLSFIFYPKYYHPKPYLSIVNERIKLFTFFDKGIFINEKLMVIFSLLLLIAFILIVVKKVPIYKNSLKVFGFLLGLLFVFSTFYKDNFWNNYYEGLPLFYLFIMAIVLAPKKTVYKEIFKIMNVILFIVLIAFSYQKGVKIFQEKPIEGGLQVQTKVVNYIQSNIKKDQKYCVKVYTPPVIPYTYDYLFLYKHQLKQYNQPEKDWVNNSCWFVLEDDDYKFRKEEWMKNNIPQKAKLKKKKKIKDVLVELKKIES